jgi:hypothetical protein
MGWGVDFIVRGEVGVWLIGYLVETRGLAGIAANRIIDHDIGFYKNRDGKTLLSIKPAPLIGRYLRVHEMESWY